MVNLHWKKPKIGSTRLDGELGRCEHRACTNLATEVRNVPYEGRVVHICSEHADIYWGYDRDWK